MKPITTLASITLAALSSSAIACVDSNANQFGTIIKNNCPKPAHVTFCFGQGCTPPDDGLFVLNPGFEKQVSNQGKRVRIAYCLLPERLVDGRCKAK